MNERCVDASSFQCGPLSVDALTDADAPKWDEFVHQHERASLYHLSAWRRVVSDLYGHETHYLYARQGNAEIAGVLPLVRLRSRLFGDYLVSMPYFNFGGAVGTSESIEQALIERGCELAKDLGVKHVEFRDSKRRAGWERVRTDKVLMQLKLPGSVDAMWSAIGTKRRTRIRRPAKEGATVHFGGAELLDDFYFVFSRNMRDLGTPAYSRSFFDRIISEFPQHASLIAVRLHGKPVSAGFLMSYRDSMEIPWGSTLREYNHLAVNMLLYWECLKKAIESGKRIFDFGRSTVDSGTFSFKQQWGAEPEQLYWHYWLNDGVSMPNLTPHNPKYRLAIRVWQRLPLFVTNALGPRIVRSLP